MNEFDPLNEFGRLITQVRHQEYERGWRDAMDAIQRAAITMYRRSNDSNPLGDEGDDDSDADEIDEPADPEIDITPLGVDITPAEVEITPPEVIAPEQEECAGDEVERSDDADRGNFPRFVTPKWAMLRR